MLKQSSAISRDPATDIRSFIRRRFKADRSLQSPSQIANGLNAGHELLDLLHASAHGERKATDRLTTLVESTVRLSESRKVFRNALRESHAAHAGSKVSDGKVGPITPAPPRSSSLTPTPERPLKPSETKVRKIHVPKFFVVQSIPLLVWSKAHQTRIGGVIRKKMAWRARKWEQRIRLTEQLIPWGSAEDSWDDLICGQAKQEMLKTKGSVIKGEGDSVLPDAQSWASAYHTALKSVADSIWDHDNKNIERSQRMVETLKWARERAARQKAELKNRKEGSGELSKRGSD